MSDLISRQTAMDAIQKRADEIGSPYSAFWEGLIIAQDIVKNLPSAEPERTAKIHDDKIHPVIHYCGKDIVTLINPTWNYCPCCGKKLEWI